MWNTKSGFSQTQFQKDGSQTEIVTILPNMTSDPDVANGVATRIKAMKNIMIHDDDDDGQRQHQQQLTTTKITAAGAAALPPYLKEELVEELLPEPNIHHTAGTTTLFVISLAVLAFILRGEIRRVFRRRPPQKTAEHCVK